MVCDCVASVLSQGNDLTLEVVVVDDCSPDDTKKRIEERFGGDSRVKYIRNEKNSFQAVSRNNGAKVAGGEFLLFLDDDNLLGANALLTLVEEFRRNSKLGFAAPMAVHKRPGKNNLIWSLGSDFNQGRYMKRLVDSMSLTSRYLRSRTSAGRSAKQVMKPSYRLLPAPIT